MRDYEVARAEIDEMMHYITGILALCIQGEDPGYLRARRGASLRRRLLRLLRLLIIAIPLRRLRLAEPKAFYFAV